MERNFFWTLCSLWITVASFAQSFNGTTGTISDDGTVNHYTASVSGLSAPLGTDYGLVTVCLDITHTWDSDLNVHLISPSGTATSRSTHIKRRFRLWSRCRTRRIRQ